MLNKTILLLTVFLIFWGENHLTEAKLRNPFEPQIPIREEPQPEEKSNVRDLINKPRKKPQPEITKPQPKVEEKPKIVFPAVTISGVIWDTDKPQAIINDTVIREGETFEEIEVLSIKKDGITMNYKGLTKTIEP